MSTVATENGVSVSHVDPHVSGAWRHLADELSESHLAHSPEWATVIHEAYGHVPLYLAAVDAEGGAGLLPAFIVRRPLFGTVVTSMPFLDGGGPCGSSVAVADALVARLMTEARVIGADVVELRCFRRLNIDAHPMEHKVNLTLSLPVDADRVWRQLDASVRNKVRKAEKSGLTIDVGGAEHLTAFYEVFAARMRDLGSPVHAPRFLRAVLQSFGDRARIVLVRKDRTPVGGLVALAFKDIVAIPWASCLKEYLPLGPNALLYWEAIRTACAQGARRFDFGRSSRGSGTYRFKQQWGALETPLFWYTIPVGRRRISSSGHGRAAACVTELWRHLPLTATRCLGPKIRKYLIQ